MAKKSKPKQEQPALAEQEKAPDVADAASDAVQETSEQDKPVQEKEWVPAKFHKFAKGNV